MADNKKKEGDPKVEQTTAEAPAPLAPRSLGEGGSNVEGPAESAALAYKIKLENYFGPLDLLLHLVKEAEVDITRIALAKVAEQYVAYITAMQKLDIEVAGEFLSVASQLLLIKSRTLAPPENPEAEGEEDEEEGDASLELIRKLLEYKRFKDRAHSLDRMMEERAARCERPHLKIEGETPAEPLRNLELWDLVLLFSRILKSTRLDVAMNILYRDVPLEVYMDHILGALLKERRASLFELLGKETDRVKTVSMFLAMLQLARDQKVRISQDSELGDIHIEPSPESTVPSPESGGAATESTSQSPVPTTNPEPAPPSPEPIPGPEVVPSPAPKPENGGT